MRKKDWCGAINGGYYVHIRSKNNHFDQGKICIDGEDEGVIAEDQVDIRIGHNLFDLFMHRNRAYAF